MNDTSQILELQRRALARAHAVAEVGSPAKDAAASVAPDERRLWRLAELLEDPQLLQPPIAVIPSIAWRGRVTLLSAREKTGKSTLVGQGVAALSAAGEFLGVAVVGGKALWYTIDEAVGDTARRFMEFGGDPDNIFLSDEPPSAESLRKTIVETGAVVVVIDTLTALMTGRVFSDRDAMEVAQFLSPYVTVARETGVALVLLHHTTKSGEEYRGSVQFGAAVDVVLTLRAPRTLGDEEDADEALTEDDGSRCLEGKGRAGILVRAALNFDGSRYENRAPTRTLPERILDVLQNGPLSRNEVAQKVVGRRQKTLAEIGDLISRGTVVETGNGKIALAAGRLAAGEGGRLDAFDGHAMRGPDAVVSGDVTSPAEVVPAREPVSEFGNRGEGVTAADCIDNMGTRLGSGASAVIADSSAGHGTPLDVRRSRPLDRPPAPGSETMAIERKLKTRASGVVRGEL